MSAESLTTFPNLLSLSRLPLAVALFALIAWEQWAAALVVFAAAMFTDWLDGWWARRTGQQSAVGRALDPLADKVLIGGAFIYLLPVPGAGLDRWMVTVVICRELLITGLRGMIEAAGKRFGADWFGKLKTVLQTAALAGIFVLQTLRGVDPNHPALPTLDVVQLVLLYAMIAATVGSAVQYSVKASKLLK